MQISLESLTFPYPVEEWKGENVQNCNWTYCAICLCKLGITKFEGYIWI